MLSENMKTASKVENVMREIYEKTSVEFNIYVSEINADGVKPISL
jgi:hypothetical protein